MSRALPRTILLLVLLAATVMPAAAESRVALIIANAAYQNTSPLKNPVNDGKLMAATLESTGFKVTLATDLDGKAMKKAMLEFGRALRASDSVGLFYYAGHAIQVAGENYLIPIDANLQDETEIGIEGVDVNDFLATMNQAQSRIKIVVLDACRNNPFPATSRSGTRGLAIVRAPTGTLIAYSTSPGEVALDGTADNSPYALALAGAMKAETGKPIELVFRQARVAVLEATEGLQTPWDLSSITGDFVLASGDGAGSSGTDAQAVDSGSTTSAASTGGSANDAAKDYAVWIAIEASGNEAAYRAYLEEFPNGRFSTAAKQKLAALEQLKVDPATLLAFAERYLGSAADNQSDRSNLYAAQVEYFDKGMVPKEQVLVDKLDYFAKFPLRRYVFDRSSFRTGSSSDGSYQLSFEYDFAVENDQQKIAGRGKTELGVNTTGKTPLIEREQGSVLRKSVTEKSSGEATKTEQSAQPARNIARLFPDSGKRQLSPDELYGLSCDQLWVARNEMFDRRGYCFTSGRGQSYFDNADCTTSDAGILNKTEKANVTTIKEVEAAQGCQGAVKN